MNHFQNLSQQDQYFLKLAYEHAKKYSPDPRTQNGAILVNAKSLEIISYGANCFPDGVQALPERLERAVKYQYLEHAERCAIFSAAKKGYATQGAILYVPWFACADCAKAIIGSGISCVVGHAAPCQSINAWNSSIEIGLKLLDEAKVPYRYYEGRIGVAGLLFDGEMLSR